MKNFTYLKYQTLKGLLLGFIILINSFSLRAQTGMAPSKDGDVYQIASLENLVWIKEKVNSGTTFSGENFIQTADIDATATSASSWNGGFGWEAIGGTDNSYTFSGSYNGQGHTISNLYINNPTANYYGLFGYCGGATIQNLGVTNVSITAGEGVGGLAGDIGVDGNGTVNSSISNCYVTGNITSTGTVGGLIGTVEEASTVSNCYANCTITDGQKAGGLVGMMNGNLSNSYALGSITASHASYIGGLVGGIQYSAGKINSCFSSCTITINGESSDGKSFTGGFIGYTYRGSSSNIITIDNCYATGSIYGTSFSAASRIGGFIGENTGTVSYCYTTVKMPTTGATTLIGGFVGQNSNDGAKITNPFDYGTINNNCFWNSTLYTNGYGDNTGATFSATGKTTTEMQTKSTYTSAGWDFVGGSGPNYYWNIGSAYPYLNWSPAPGAPTIGTATAGDGQALVPFTAPSPNGGSAITGYTVTSNPGNKTGSGTASPITVFGLTNGTSYNFTVTATNGAGTSAASAASNSVIPKGAQTITFSDPGAQNFGTTPTLTASASSGLTPTFTSSTTGVCTITSGGTLSFITPGTCTINADQAGNSTYAAATTVSRSFSVNAVVAGAPTIGTATAGDGQALVTFTAPSSNGGSAISEYTVTSNPGNITKSGTASPITVSGLTNGTSYTFTITATNGAGTSAASAVSNSITPGAATSSFTTTGNWSTAGNWSNGVPGTPTSATISSGTCTLDADATVTNLTVSPGASLTISSGTLTVTGTLTLDADASGIASLINNGTITATNTTVKSFLTKNIWHVVSSPTPLEQIGTFIDENKNYIQSTGSSPVYYGVMNYNEGTNSWNKGTSYFTIASTTQFGAGYGYGVLPIAANDVTVSYKGTLASTTSNISVGLTNTGEGWNCIGNPYSSSLNINESAGTSFLNQNASANLDENYACVYIWDGASSSYKILGNSPVSLSSGRYLTQNYVAPGQGFFVKAKGTGSPSVTFTPAMQSHQNSTALLKSARITWPAIRLNVVNNSDTTSTIVAFNSAMTKGLDPTYDAGLLRGTTGLNLYSRLVNDNGVDFAIQCLPEKYDSLVIPLGIECKKGGDITFNAETVELPASCNVILEDKATKTFTSLDNGGSYTATVNAGSAGTGRFYLHTSSLSTVTDVPSQNADNAVNACAKGKVIYVTGSKLSGSDAKLYDISGRSINTYKLTSDGTVTLDESSLVNGVYVLHITSSGKAYAFKVILKD